MKKSAKKKARSWAALKGFGGSAKSPDKSILDLVKKRRLPDTVEEMLAPPSEPGG